MAAECVLPTAATPGNEAYSSAKGSQCREKMLRKTIFDQSALASFPCFQVCLQAQGPEARSEASLAF